MSAQVWWGILIGVSGTVAAVLIASVIRMAGAMERNPPPPTAEDLDLFDQIALDDWQEFPPSLTVGFAHRDIVIPQIYPPDEGPILFVRRHGALLFNAAGPSEAERDLAIDRISFYLDQH